MLIKDPVLPFINRMLLIVILLISSYSFVSLADRLLFKNGNMFILITAYKPEFSS